MRSLLILLLALTVARAADFAGPPPFEILPGDRVLLLGDVLLEREGTYGYLETRMHEQFADRPFTVRNLSFAGDTPLGVSRAAFDPPAKGWERLIEQIDLVRPTVVFLGYGMAASLQEMTDRSQDPTLNRDTARYGEEPMSAARFKKELGQLMDAIVQKAKAANMKAGDPATPGSALVPSAGSGVPPERTSAAVATGDAQRAATTSEVREGGTPSPALGTSALPGVRFVLLSPIRHEDLRATRPGLPDPAEHNKLLAAYSKAIEELAKERGARFVDLAPDSIPGALPIISIVEDKDGNVVSESLVYRTDNGIHLNLSGYGAKALVLADQMGWPYWPKGTDLKGYLDAEHALRAAIIAKNELFFHRWRPANSTYLTGFRKHEQGQNAKEMPMFDPLIEKAEAEIERLKKSAGEGTKTIQPTRPAHQSAPPTSQPARPASQPPSPALQPARPEPQPASPALQTARPPLQTASPSPQTASPASQPARPALQAPSPASQAPPPLPTFTVADGYQIELWAQNPLMEKPTQMNWDALGRLWVCSSSLYPMIEPGQAADDKILILSDPERTGKATKSEVFARGLLIPTGVVPDLGESKRRTSNVERQTSNEAVAAPPPPQASDPSTFSVQRSTFDVSPPPHPPAYGCYVGQSTELLHFAADGTKRIVLSGFGTEDTHHIIHTLRWGPDGRLYFNQSIYIHSHLETPWGLVRVNSGAALAYDPRTERTEVFVKGFINTWGHAWDRWGQSFFTDGAGGGGINWGFPGAQFVTYEGARQTVPSVSPGAYPKFAGLEIIYSPHFPADWQGNAITCDFRAHRIVRFAITDLSAPAAADGAERRTSNAEHQTSNATTAAPPTPSEPSKFSVQRSTFDVSPSQSGYITREMPDLVRTADLSFRPIDVKLGPDGALYVADWSNPVINHGEVDFRDPRRDKHMGRIWRISKKGEPVVKWEPLVGKKTPELLDGLLSGSQWEKEQARRVLTQAVPNIWDQRLESFDILSKWTFRGGPKVGALADAPNLEAAWLSHAAGLPYAHAMASVYASGDPRARAIGTRIFASTLAEPRDHFWRPPMVPYSSERQQEEDRIATLAGWPVGQDRRERQRLFYNRLSNASKDQDPRVRLEAMRALARIPTAYCAELVLDAALKAPEGDVFYNHAAWLSINDLAQPWLDALASGAWKAEGRERQLEFALNALPPAAARGALAKVLGAGPRDFAKGPWAELIGRAGDPAQLRQLFDALLVSFGTHCCPGEELKNLNATPIDDATALRCVNALLEAARVRNQRPTGDLLPLERLVFHTNAALRTGVLRLVGYWKPAPGLDWLRGVFDENALDPAPAAAAIESARDIGGAPAIALLKKLAAPASAAPTRQRAAVALAALDAKAPEIAAALAAAPTEDAALTAWRDLFKTQKAIDALVEKLPADLPKPVAAAGVRAARETGKRGTALLAALTPLAGPMTKPVLGPADFKAIAARMWTQGGDAAQGELIYRRATSGCVTCHAIGGAGGVVGPSLTSLGASAPLDYIIESMLVPAAKVKEGYNGVTLKLKDGSEVMGIQTRETATEVILRNVAGQETAVVKANIAGKTDIGSIMPAGLIEAWTDNERMNLYAFLGELGKPGPFDASKSQVARVWRLYPGTATDAALRGAPHDASANALTLVDGRLLNDSVREALQLVTNPGAVIYAVTQFQSTGKTRLDLTGIAKAFLDGQPLTITSDLAPELPAGLHTLAVKLDVPSLPEVLRAASTDASFVTN